MLIWVSCIFKHKCVKCAYAKKVKYLKLMLWLLDGTELDFTHFMTVFCFYPITVFFFFLGFVPVCSVGVCQVARLNLGKSVSTLKYFTICGLQEGYEPFAVNMNRDVTMWISKRLPQFVPIPTNHQHIQVEPGQHTCTFGDGLQSQYFKPFLFLGH